MAPCKLQVRPNQKGQLDVEGTNVYRYASIDLSMNTKNLALASDCKSFKDTASNAVFVYDLRGEICANYYEFSIKKGVYKESLVVYFKLLA
jgi:hypothetical protein